MDVGIDAAVHPLRIIDFIPQHRTGAALPEAGRAAKARHFDVHADAVAAGGLGVVGGKGGGVVHRHGAAEQGIHADGAGVVEGAGRRARRAGAKHPGIGVGDRHFFIHVVDRCAAEVDGGGAGVVLGAVQRGRKLIVEGVQLLRGGGGVDGPEGVKVGAVLLAGVVAAHQRAACRDGHGRAGHRAGDPAGDIGHLGQVGRPAGMAVVDGDIALHLPVVVGPADHINHHAVIQGDASAGWDRYRAGFVHDLVDRPGVIAGEELVGSLAHAEVKAVNCHRGAVAAGQRCVIGHEGSGIVVRPFIRVAGKGAGIGEGLIAAEGAEGAGKGIADGGFIVHQGDHCAVEVDGSRAGVILGAVLGPYTVHIEVIQLLRGGGGVDSAEGIGVLGVLLAGVVGANQGTAGRHCQSRAVHHPGNAAGIVDDLGQFGSPRGMRVGDGDRTLHLPVILIEAGLIQHHGVLGSTRLTGE